MNRAYIYDETDVSGMKFNTVEIPAEYKDDATTYRDALIAAISDFDDNIAEKYLEGTPLTEDEFKQGVRKATLTREFVGVIPGSAFKNKGVQMLLDAVVDYLPSPLDLPPMRAFKDDQEIGITPDDSAPLVGLVFKLWTDPFVGRLVFFRVYSGVLRKGMTLYNPRNRKTERISRLVVMKAADRVDIDAAYSGDICAVIGVRDSVTGDTLTTKEMDVMLEPPTFPEPVISMSIEPDSKADQEKLSLALQRLSDEDPTFRVSSNAETGQTIIAGMGELHLDIIRDRLFREFSVQAKAGKPQIAYRESITGSADGEGKFIRQSGGRGQYGHVCVKIEPNEKGKGIEVINEVVVVVRFQRNTSSLQPKVLWKVPRMVPLLAIL
jgi:elongation factor G